MSQNQGKRKLCFTAIQGHHVPMLFIFPLLPILEKTLDVRVC